MWQSMKRVLRALDIRRVPRRLERIEALLIETRNIEIRLERLETLLLGHPQQPAVTTISFASPAVTVVMPTWNRAHVLPDAIRSVQAQTFTDWELIVVDDASTDGTSVAMQQFVADPRIRYIAQDHAGQCVARNRALAESRGALIAYCDSDNLWYPGFLAAAVPVFTANPAIQSLYGAMMTDAHHPGEWLVFEPWDRAKLELGNYIDMSTFIHRRTLYEQHGGFDPTIRRLDDWDLILRYTAESPPHRLPALAVRYRAVDSIRLTDTEALEPDVAAVRRKLRDQR